MLDLAESHQTRTPKPARELQFYKCDYCRRDKKKCLPTDRRHPQRCERCSEKGLPCSRPVRSGGSKPHYDPEAAEQPVTSPAPSSPPQTKQCDLESGQTAVEFCPLETRPVDLPPGCWPIEVLDEYDISAASVIDARMTEATQALAVASAPTQKVSGAMYSRGAVGTMRREGKATTTSLKRRTAGGRSAATPRQRHQRSGQGTYDHDTDIPDDDANEPPSERPLFACPFYKFDPMTHFRCFRKYDLRRYSDVKQHILRCHTLGSLYCSNCWQSFTSNQEMGWMAHVQQLDCQRSQLPEDLLPNEARELTALEFHVPLPDEEKWYEIWDLLFAGHPRPPSPYMDAGFSELVSLMNYSREFVQDSLPSLLHSQGIGQESAVTLAEQIHHMYTVAFSTPTTVVRRRLQSRIDATESNT